MTGHLFFISLHNVHSRDNAWFTTYSDTSGDKYQKVGGLEWRRAFLWSAAASSLVYIFQYIYVGFPLVKSRDVKNGEKDDTAPAPKRVRERFIKKGKKN